MQQQRTIQNIILGCWGLGTGYLLYRYFPWQNNLAIGGLVGLGVMLCFLKRHFQGGINRFYPQYHNLETVVITGANTGLGRICAEELAKLNPATVIMACRSRQRAEQAMKEIQQSSTQNFNLEFMELDLNDLESVQRFAKQFNQQYNRLDLLLNNAGIMALQTRQESMQGYEKHLAVNHFGHFLLTKLLMDKLKVPETSRIVNVSSLAHKRGKFDFDNLHLTDPGSYKPWPAYGQSKLANVYFTRELARRLEEEGCTSVKTCSLHPGVVRTELGRYMFEGRKLYQAFFTIFMLPLFCFFTKTPWQGSQTSLHCCLIDHDQLDNGKYYADCKVVQETMPEDWADQAKRLWEMTEEAVKNFATVS